MIGARPVACGEPTFEDAEVDTLLNPTLLVEVLSKSTEDYDRGGEFEHYRTIESLREYLLVAQDKAQVGRASGVGPKLAPPPHG